MNARLERFAVRAAIVLAVLGFDPRVRFAFEPVKAAAVQVIGLALLVAAAADALARLASRDRRAWGFVPLDAAAVALSTVALLATVMGISPALSVWGEAEQRDGLLTTLALAGLYVGVRRTHGSPMARETTLRTWLGASAVAALGALPQVFALERGGPRATSTLGNPILLGTVLAPALAITTARLRDSSRGAAAYATLAALFAVSLLGTLSRGAMIAGVAGVAVALAAPRREWSRPGAGAAGVALTATLAVAIALRAGWIARLTEDLRGGGLSTSTRREIAASALAMWRSRPWSGVGPDAFGLAFPRFQTAAFWRDEWVGMPGHAHSTVLQALATGGVLAAAAGAGAIVVLVHTWRAIPDHDGSPRREVAAAFVALATACTLHVAGIAGAAFGVTLAALATAAGAGGAAPASASRRRASAVGGAVALAALAALTAWNLRAGRAEGRVQAALETADARGDAPNPVSLRRDVAAATRSVPDNDSAWRLRCDAELALGRAARARGDVSAARDAALAAERSARRALALQPGRAFAWQRLGDALAFRTLVVKGGAAGDVDSAEAAFELACVLAPRNALVLVDRARAELEMNEPVRALGSARRIQALDPAAALGFALEAAAQRQLGHPDELRAALRRAVGARWEVDDKRVRRNAVRVLARLDSAATATTTAHR